MEMILGLLIPALSGAAGGNIIGKVAGALNGGGMMNTILGAVGGLGAGTVLGSMGMDATGGAEAAEAVSNFDVGTLLSGVLGGAGGGAALGGVGGIIKNMMSKS
ncbi:hypothetical protein L0666_12430 [Octadecabacter sp. CECT 8868]|uniref:hypothetical protein n=1 Tax=Octadecabacter algicola TaxID=2909342 RepID=UPI001F1C1593|nr:hypothetical protein [Octadecabacter algicola]MCF2905796.1 hypothetical protein [Octadecabacter algicola]